MEAPRRFLGRGGILIGSSAALETHALTRVFKARRKAGEVRALQGIDLAVHRGEWNSRWFRSRGTIPTRWVAALGGDGNVRGFADTRPSGRTLLAVNVESRSSRLVPAWIPVLHKLRLPVLDPRSSLFADLGKVQESDESLLSNMAADFGVGIRTRPLIRNRLTLRVDMPFFRTPPRPDESRWRLRGVFSVGEAF